MSVNGNVYAALVSSTWMALETPTTPRTWIAIEQRVDDQLGVRGVLREVSLNEEWRVGRPLVRTILAPHCEVSDQHVQLQ